MSDLRGFVDALLKEYWRHGPGDIDGGWLQDTLLKHGIIKSVPYDPAVHGEMDYDEGDEIFVSALA